MVICMYVVIFSNLYFKLEKKFDKWNVKLRYNVLFYVCVDNK